MGMVVCLWCCRGPTIYPLAQATDDSKLCSVTSLGHIIICLFNKQLRYQSTNAWRSMSVEILSTAAQAYKQITFGKACSWGMTLKASQNHLNWCHMTGHIVVYNNDAYIWHYFQDTTTLRVKVTVCNIENPSFFKRQLKLAAKCTFSIYE